MSLIIFYKQSSKSSSSYIQADNVNYDVEIHDRFALCKLKQTFNITTENITEAEYRFPVDFNSAFCDLVIKTPREEIKGIVKEKVEAKKIYEIAKSEGKQAFLTDESETDRDIYKLTMSNLLLGDKIIVKYTYVTEVAYNDGSNVFYIPTFISPRYGSNCIIDNNHNVSCRITICGYKDFLKPAVANMVCSFDDKDQSVCVEYQSTKPLEKDIEIFYRTNCQNKALKFTSNGYTLAMAQFMPEFNNTLTNRDVLFVVDCSGSMDGDRIQNARTAIIHCLKQLPIDPTYHFNIMRYGSTYEFYSPSMLECSKDNIDKAITYCASMGATLGGTETYAALKEALTLCKSVILLTDGDTSNNSELHKLCAQFDRLSILGIGSGINRANIVDMAKRGHGMALFNQTEDDTLKNTDTIFKNIYSSLITNPKFNWCLNKKNLVSNYSVIPNNLSTHYAILNGTPELNKFQLSALGLDLEFEPLPEKYIDAKYLGCLIAKRIIQENTDSTLKENKSEYLTKDQIIKLAVDFNIITPYTSIIAVGTVICKDDKTDTTASNVYETNSSLLYRGPQGALGLPGSTGPQGPQGAQGNSTYNSRIASVVSDSCVVFTPPDTQNHSILECGEMERDAMCSHGIAQFLKERREDYSFDVNRMLPTKCDDDWFDTTKTETIEYDNAKLNELEKTRRENVDKVKIMKEQFNSGVYRGVNTISHSYRNGTYDIRGDIPNPKIQVSPWLNCTVESDVNINPITTSQRIPTQLMYNVAMPSADQSKTATINQDICRTTLKESTVQIPYNTTITPINQSKTSVIIMDDSYVKKKEQYYKNFFYILMKWKASELIPCVNNVDLDNCDFDPTTGLFSKNIINTIYNIPYHVLIDPMKLTLYVLSFIAIYQPEQFRPFFEAFYHANHKS